MKFGGVTVKAWMQTGVMQGAWGAKKSTFGSYTNSAGNGHGYRLDHGTLTTIDFPGEVFTFTGGSNASGDRVGPYTILQAPPTPFC